MLPFLVTRLRAGSAMSAKVELIGEEIWSVKLFFIDYIIMNNGPIVQWARFSLLSLSALSTHHNGQYLEQTYVKNCSNNI